MSSRVVPMKRRLVNYTIREEGRPLRAMRAALGVLGAAMRELSLSGWWRGAREECGRSDGELRVGGELAEMAGQRREAV